MPCCYQRQARWSRPPHIESLYASHLPLCWLQVQRRVLLAITGSGQQVHDIEVVFVAHVLVLLLFRIDLRPWNHRGPWLGPRRWIRNRELVVDAVGSDARESFRNLVCLSIRSLIHRAIVGSEVRRLDDERVAIEVTTCVA